MLSVLLSIVLATVTSPSDQKSRGTNQKPVTLTPEVRAKLKEIAFNAARQGDVKTIAEYLKVETDVNATNTRGDTLLILATYYGKYEAALEILKHPKLDIDKKNSMGLTALAAAAYKGDQKLTKLLLQHKATVDASSPSGQTALMFAALTNRVEISKLLVEAGANPQARDKQGNTPVSLAKQQGAKEVSEYFGRVISKK